MASTGIADEVRIGAQGRIIIPAHLRKELNLKPGDRLIVRSDGDRILLERRQAVANRLLSRFNQVPTNVSLVDELIAERRAEAAREDGEE
jgi:AbrB family looped-hinge helix DNA binding protein